LIPDYGTGSVKPIIGNGPCDKSPSHTYVLMTKDGKIYAMMGSEEAMHKVEMMSERKNVKIRGKVEGNQMDWILFVE
jgi:IMP dehydrogenase/GMP reductase